MMSDKIVRWLPVIISVLVIIASVAAVWGSLDVRVARNETDIECCINQISDIEQAVPQIQADLEWIKRTLTRMENGNE